MSEILSPSRRRLLRAGVASIMGPTVGRALGAEATEWDFGAKGIDGWNVVTGDWSVRDLGSAPGWGKRVLMQQATRNTYNVIVSPLGPFGDVDVSMRFRPISGREDASGGIVFRFDGGRYYLIRANALEDNFRLYYYEGSRRMLSSASVRAPALGEWHTVRALAVGDRLQGWLNGTLLLDYRDQRFKAGRVGLWTKADSVTAFDAFAARAPS